MSVSLIDWQAVNSAHLKQGDLRHQAQRTGQRRVQHKSLRTIDLAHSVSIRLDSAVRGGRGEHTEFKA